MRRTVVREVVVGAPPAPVWERVVTQDGIDDEMRPWVTMRLPGSVAGETIETMPRGRSVGRAWLRLLGVVPFDYDDLTLVEVEPGVRFLERSTMLSMRSWEHERTLTAVPGGTRVQDRLVLEPRLPVPGLAAVLTRVVDVFFAHRHRRLERHFGPVVS